MKPTLTLWRPASRPLAALMMLVGLMGPALARGEQLTVPSEPAGFWVPAAPHNRGARQPRVLVLHYTGSSRQQTFDYFTQGHVSAHYTVDRDGALFQHVSEQEAAHHAGVSYWHMPGVNHTSLGVEIVNSGYIGFCTDGNNQDGASLCSGGSAWERFTEAQVQQVIALCQNILQRYPIDPFDVVGHADIAPGRKQDPGPAFPWLRLARAGIGVGYDQNLGILVHGDASYPLTWTGHVSVGAMQQQLASLGYNVPQHGIMERVTRDVLLAFNSHYLGAYSGAASDETRAVLHALWRWRNAHRTQALLQQSSL